MPSHYAYSSICRWNWLTNTGFGVDIYLWFDVDTCDATQWNTCSENAHCVSRQTGHKCLCNFGFVGDEITCNRVQICVTGEWNNIYTWMYFDELKKMALYTVAHHVHQIQLIHIYGHIIVMKLMHGFKLWCKFKTHSKENEMNSKP